MRELVGTTGLILPTFPQHSTPGWCDGSGGDGGLGAMAGEAEALGVGALWVTDHLFWHGPCLECVVAMGIVVVATKRVAVGSCVMQLPLRRADGVAKQISSLQGVSGGRMVLGVGVGAHSGEYEQVGAAYHMRGHELDAGIGELRRAWHTEGSGGEGWGPGPYRMLPQLGRVPVWVGGSSRAALTRAARLGDGWMPLFLSPGEYAKARGELSGEVGKAGREADAVLAAMVVFISIDDNEAAARARGLAWMGSMYRTPGEAFAQHLVAGGAAAVAERLGAWRAAGAEHIVVYVTDDAPMEQFAALLAAMGHRGR